MHCPLYNVHTLYTVHLHTVHSTLNSVHCTLYTVHCTLYTAHCTLYRALTHWTNWWTRCTQCTQVSLCTVHSLQCTLYSALTQWTGGRTEWGRRSTRAQMFWTVFSLVILTLRLIVTHHIRISKIDSWIRLITKTLSFICRHHVTPEFIITVYNSVQMFEPFWDWSPHIFENISLSY